MSQDKKLKPAPRRVTRVEFIKPVNVPGAAVPRRVLPDPSDSHMFVSPLDPEMWLEGSCIVVGTRRYPLAVVESFDLEE